MSFFYRLPARLSHVCSNFGDLLLTHLEEGIYGQLNLGKSKLHLRKGGVRGRLLISFHAGYFICIW
jgi:hypothetical protein